MQRFLYLHFQIKTRNMFRCSIEDRK